MQSLRRPFLGRGPRHARASPARGRGPVTDRDVNAARDVVRRGIAKAGRDIGSLGRLGACEGVPEPHVAGLPGQDAERRTAD